MFRANWKQGKSFKRFLRPLCENKFKKNDLKLYHKILFLTIGHDNIVLLNVRKLRTSDVNLKLIFRMNVFFFQIN